MTFGASLSHRYGAMLKSMSHAAVHSKMMAAKGAAIHSSIPHGLKVKMISGYRSAEHSLFGSTTNLPGENAELGVSGLNMGQRMSIRHAAEQQINNPSPNGETTDLTQSLMSRYNPSSSE